MIEIRYSAPDSLDVSGTASKLQTLRQRILELPKLSQSQIAFDADRSIDPAPYQAVLSKLVVTLSDGPTKISVADGHAVHITGSQPCLEALASFFDLGGDPSDGAHAHYEYYEGNNFIAPDSVPLVINVNETRAFQWRHPTNR